MRHPKRNAMGPYAYRRDQWVGYDDVDIIKQKVKTSVNQMRYHEMCIRDRVRTPTLIYQHHLISISFNTFLMYLIHLNTFIKDAEIVLHFVVNTYRLDGTCFQILVSVHQL